MHLGQIISKIKAIQVKREHAVCKNDSLDDFFIMPRRHYEKIAQISFLTDPLKKA